MKFDLHMHTTRHSPDSEMDPFSLVRQARKVGLDGVVITESTPQIRANSLIASRDDVSAMMR